MWTEKQIMRHEVDVYSLRLMDGERVVAYVEGVEGGAWYARRWPTGKLIGQAATQPEAMRLAEMACSESTQPV